MKKKLLLLVVYFCLPGISAYSTAQVDSVLIESRSMNDSIKTIVILPETALNPNPQKCPVIYLLNGYSGNEKQWIGIKPDLPQIANEKGVIFVCPDGRNSWYLDSPLDQTSQYETFISSELVAYIDEHYNTLADRKYRAITGLSMGGHGALYNAFRHKEIFGAVGSTSGAVDIRQRGDNFGLVHLLGDNKENKENWERHSVLNQIDNLSNGDLAIYFDCGTSDFCFQLNEALNQALLNKGIDHDYTIRPGEHNASYWRNAIDYHILFFCKYFERVKN
ncbi:MAG: esterase family protein [Dysgonamonadaceae bacterium]|jgi:S-formylglutathione hydrolase FrmB|nr:esterase family protein [Dysgonamonadaceae bacterium]